MHTPPDDRAPPVVGCNPVGLPAKQFPALSGLGFGENDLAALRRQGFVSCEQRRPEHAPIYKLRYRIQGRQRTRFLGNNLAFLDAVRRELAELQQAIKGDRQMRRVLRQARRGLRQAKSTLAPLLAEQGYSFHGRVLRRRRQAGARVRAGANEPSSERSEGTDSATSHSPPCHNESGRNSR
jgi:hypothetical protein